MTLYRRYSWLFGLLGLILVIIVLFSTPGLVFSPGVTFVDTELSRSSGSEIYVRTKMDLGDVNNVNALPKKIGVWSGYDYDTESLRENLGADVILLRGYDCPGLYQPINFLIMQAKTESSFHPPPVCYASQGFTIVEEDKESLLVTDTKWLATSTDMIVPLQKMVVTKESGESIAQRRVLLYFYVKGNQFTSDTVTLIWVEGLAPIEGPYDGILGVEKEFLASALPYIFEPGESKQWSTLAGRLANSGASGYFAIAMLIFVPLLVIIYPRIRWGKRSGV
jgi:hypothetical protein